MFKLLKIIVALAIIVIVLGVIGVLWAIDSIARQGVERGATYALGVKTTLNDADVGVFSGTFGMSGLKVDNPEGYDTPHFLVLDDGNVAVSLGSLREETVEVPELTLSGIDLNLQKKGNKANYQVILDNLKKFESGREPADPKEDGKKFVIRKLLITDVVAHVDLLPIGGEATRLDVPIEKIELRDVGSDDKPLQIADLSNVILKAIFAAIIDNGGSIIPSDVLGGLQNGLAGLTDLSAMGIDMTTIGGKALEKALGEIGKGAGDEIGKGLEGLGGLLGGKKDDPKKSEEK